MCELCGGTGVPKAGLTRRQILTLSVSLAAGMALGLSNCEKNTPPSSTIPTPPETPPATTPNAPETPRQTTPATTAGASQSARNAGGAGSSSAPASSQTQLTQGIGETTQRADEGVGTTGGTTGDTTLAAPDLGAEVFPNAQGRALAKASDAPVIIVPRSDWTTTGPNLGQIVPMNGVNRLTVHHTAGAIQTDAWGPTAGQLESIREFHAGRGAPGRNWADIAYHFAVDRAGRVWQARPLAYQGAHAWQHNEHNLGIVLLGNFEVQSPSAAQLTALAGFIGFVRKLYAIPLNEIYTHGELVDTSCPGKLLQEYMDRARGEWGKGE